jgi:hypothetical protein
MSSQYYLGNDDYMYCKKCKQAFCSWDVKNKPCWDFRCGKCKARMVTCSNEGVMFCLRCTPFNANVFQKDVYFI